MSPSALAAWAAFGIFVGAYGTLVGAGGGFLMVPALMWAAGASPEVAAGTSLAVVLFNAVSGTWAYARRKLVDWRTALLFAAATVPGGLLGPKLLHFVPENAFLIAFGVLMLGIAALLGLRPREPKPVLHINPMDYGPPGFRALRQLTDAEGNTYRIHYNVPAGLALSFVVGFLSSMLGIGGGVIHVPALIYLLGFPAHLAVATSHATLAVSAGVGVFAHARLDHILWPLALASGCGALAGAQIGAALSRRVKTAGLLRALALAVALVGLRCLWMGFFPA